MPKGIVDGLETIKIDHHKEQHALLVVIKISIFCQSLFFALAVDSVYLSLNELVEIAAVVQFSQ